MFSLCIISTYGCLGGARMNEIAYQRLTHMASEPEAMEKAVAYLESNLRQFLKKRDKVLICFPDEPASVGGLMKRAVLRCEAEPQFLGTDQRWLTLLRTAFVSRCDAIIGPPLTILGLAKVAKHMSTPLFARNILVAGYPIKEWMVNGIERGLDCRAWGCYDPGSSAMIAGFTCNQCCLHLRDDRYKVRILDDAGRELPRGETGRVVLSPICDVDIRFDTGDLAWLEEAPCKCGSAAPRLMDIDTNNGIDPRLSKLGEDLHYWGSILDCKLSNTGYGLELELVVFPGEKLPKLPNCAKLVVRAWNPETDAPFPHGFALKKRLFSQD